MFKLDVFKTRLIQKGSRLLLKGKKYSPEICMAIGTVAFVGTVVLAARATLKIDEVLDESEDRKRWIEDNKDTPNYSEEEYQRDKVVVYVQTGLKLGALYTPAVATGIISLTCFYGSHIILKRRNLALMAAYKVLDGAFKDYRRRVSDELGRDADRRFKNGLEKETYVEDEVDPETGKKKKVTKEKNVIKGHSIYAKFFDETSTCWVKTPEYNKLFLINQQNYANDLLRARGHLFLNEVYDMLGLQRTQNGCLVGWAMGHGGDEFVDFGIFDVENPNKRDFVNGFERSIILDFNVDGVVYDLIK